MLPSRKTSNTPNLPKNPKNLTRGAFFQGFLESLKRYDRITREKKRSNRDERVRRGVQKNVIERNGRCYEVIHNGVNRSGREYENLVNLRSFQGEEFDRVVYLKKYVGVVSFREYRKAVGEMFVKFFFQTPGLVTFSDWFVVGKVMFIFLFLMIIIYYVGVFLFLIY